MDQTCKALAQVRLWQRDTVLEEMKATIAQQEQQLASRDEKIQELLKGGGPIGEVLRHIYEQQLVVLDIPVSDELRRIQTESFARQTRSVREVIESVYWVVEDIGDVLRHGGYRLRSHSLPRLQ